MKRARLKNLPASVHQRLLNLSREKGEEPNQVFLRHEEVYNLARNVRKSSTLESSPHFRNFIAVALEALGKKLLVIKRIGTNYIPEVGSIQRDLTEVVVDFFCVASYYREDPKIAEQLSEQFFLSKKMAYLAQYQFAKSTMKNDVFLTRKIHKKGSFPIQAIVLY